MQRRGSRWSLCFTSCAPLATMCKLKMGCELQAGQLHSRAHKIQERVWKGLARHSGHRATGHSCWVWRESGARPGQQLSLRGLGKDEGWRDMGYVWEPEGVGWVMGISPTGFKLLPTPPFLYAEPSALNPSLLWLETVGPWPRGPGQAVICFCLILPQRSQLSGRCPEDLWLPRSLKDPLGIDGLDPRNPCPFACSDRRPRSTLLILLPEQ